jgi:subtilase family serine protease
MASWDGTSFSTPMVAGLIAARMTTHNQTAKDAWAFLLARAATQPGSDSGPRLFPGDEV